MALQARALALALFGLLSSSASALDSDGLRARIRAVAGEAFASTELPSGRTPVQKKKPDNAGHYIRPASLTGVTEFPAAPAPGSDTDKADLAAMHRLQDARSEADCARARSEESPTYEVLFGALSPFPDPLPKRVDKLLKQVGSDADIAGKIIKHRDQRPRPPLRDSTLHPCVQLPTGFSYPSYHAVISRLYALILSDLVPERRAAFMARADEAALDRNIGGVHFPSDSEAGKRIADLLYPEFRNSHDFASDFDAARGELTP